ncbi:ATP-binding protein [Prosthecomicrobium hirschii]|uniref:ATP-binding protein n=1 Tax=Prosthecodimorpha hirschii TaxID=665126 RepID=UPI00221EA865|nr:MoxR family ATPase [Prosthecomicrobium hirschii]MCW1841964.1 MoxR family ATPase [Prosthecomicrobium hirschii]
MEAAAILTPSALAPFLLNVAPAMPVFIWGPPGIGKSALVRGFADAVGLPCVSLLGSQLAPEDIIGVPQIVDGKSRFCPPTLIARDEPYCLFLDELNACSHEVQKAFYSLVLDRRVGEFELPKGSIVIGAGNRAEDQAITRPLSSALVNRLIHVQLRASPRDWLEWARPAGIDPLVLAYVENRSDHLWSKPPKHEEPFSTPRSWHMLSDALGAYGPRITIDDIRVLAAGLLTPAHAQAFVAFARMRERAHDLSAILKGERGWPERPEERDILYFMVHQLRDRLIKELPDEESRMSREVRDLAQRSKELIVSLARISTELAQILVAETESGAALPAWYTVELARALPRLAAARK